VQIIEATSGYSALGRLNENPVSEVFVIAESALNAGYRVVLVCWRQKGQLCRPKRRMESRLPNGWLQNHHVRTNW